MVRSGRVLKAAAIDTSFVMVVVIIVVVVGFVTAKIPVRTKH
jgi:hypothetical protein